jgi:hypothetical protein
MRMTRTYGSHLDLIFLEIFNFFRHLVVLCIAMAKLAVLSVAPGEDPPLGGKGHGVLPATGNVGYLNFDETFYRRGNRVVICVTMAQLPENPATPGQQHAVLGHTSRVMVT